MTRALTFALESKAITMNTKFSYLLGIFSVAIILSSCSKDYGCTDPNAANYDASAEEDCCCYYAPPSTDNVVISSAITSDTEWTNDNIYELDGRIAVEAGATLTIQEGTIIKGQAGSGPNASALLIARNAKLIAEGTADMPIIFTSVARCHLNLRDLISN